MNNIAKIGNKCIGCRACELSCPKHCIECKPNKEGFIYPYVEESKCVDCGICLKKCSQAKEQKSSNKVLACYGIANKNKTDLFKSASGGVADLVSKYILEKNGIVFGAVYNMNLEVIHKGIEKIEEKYRLQSSKYVQSDLRYTYEQAKIHLENERKVLFTGTPCQIDGLYKFLGKNYDNLYTIDLICHGVPSPLMFKKYLEYLERKIGEKVESYNFRSKIKGWGTQYLLITKTKTKTKMLSLDKYGKQFIEGNCYRESCYNCKYTNLNRPADLTIGDFWGVEKFYPKIKSNLGISSVLVNSTKGLELITGISPDAEFFEIKIYELISKQGNLQQPTNRPKIRDSIYSNIDKDSYIDKLKVGINITGRIKVLIPKALLMKIKRYM